MPRTHAARHAAGRRRAARGHGHSAPGRGFRGGRAHQSSPPRAPRADGIALEVPQLSENGNSVDIAVKVASPMTAADHVTAIHILSEKNPVPRRRGPSPSRRAQGAPPRSRRASASRPPRPSRCWPRPAPAQSTAPRGEVIVILGRLRGTGAEMAASIPARITLPETRGGGRSVSVRVLVRHPMERGIDGPA